MNSSSGPLPEDIHIGLRFGSTAEPVTTRQLVMYAGASGDFNPIHYDLLHAQSAGLGGVIAHGMLTMALAGRCVTEWLGMAGRVTDLGGRFVSPVRPGDAVRFEAEVEEAGDAPGSHRLKLDGLVGERQVFAGFATVHLGPPPAKD